MSALERVYRDTDSGGWGWETREQTGGGGSQSAAEIIRVGATGTLTDLSPSSPGLLFMPGDFTVLGQKGSDLSIGAWTDASFALETAAGGSFGVWGFLGLTLTADGGSAVQRFTQFYMASIGVASPNSLGGDDVIALVPGYAMDTSTPLCPYFDIDPGGVFAGQPYFGGAAGVAGDSLAVHLVLVAWSL